MAAYVILDASIHDPELYETYRQQGGPVAVEHGAEFLVRGGEVEPLEGDWNPGRIVVLRFESAERARAWYHSPAYAAARAIRQRASSSRMILVEGAD